MPATKAKTKRKPKPRVRRPMDYTDALGAAICERIADGESVKDICTPTNMPTRTTFYRWLREVDGFEDMYARAKEECADKLAEEIIGIADNSVGEDSEGIQSARLRMDARKWVAAKLKPRTYGDRQQLDIDGELKTVEIVRTGMDDDDDDED